MKLWDKGYTTDELVEKYTVGNDRESDLLLAKYDVLGSLAHTQMLHEVGLLSQDEISSIQLGLEEILATIEAGEFLIEAHYEDVHSKVEQVLIEKIGDAGKKIHMARSRNDQVLVDLHLLAKVELQRISQKINDLFDQFQALSEEHKAVLLPGYTHLQVAMPSSFGLWFGAYAEILIDDLIFVQAALKVVDQNPLGSAAGYGSSFPINRSRTTELLGFSTLKYNVVAAQMSRGKMEKAVVMALSSLASTINKFATDACMFLSQNFDFIGLPKELTTGSSIMPHKQNPDVFELMRAKCNEVHGILVQLEMKTTNMSSGYFRDYQMLKEPFFKSVDLTHQNLDMLRHSLQSLVVKPSKVDEEKYRFLFSVEALNEKVKNGTSFRDAYREIGREILEGSFEPMRSIDHTHEGSIGNLNNHEIRAKKEELLRRPFSS